MFAITILMNSSNAVPSPSWGPLMHGMLNEHLSGIWPALLHSDAARPVSQWVEPVDRQNFRWHLHLLDDRLALSFLESCSTGDQWYCQHNGSMLTFLDIAVSSIAIEEYIDRHLEIAPPSEIALHFRTPTTHKSQSKYVLFPEPELIVRNLRNRLCGLNESFSLPDEHMQLIINHSRIRKYQLQTALFGVEGTFITGYTGNLVLRLDGPPAIMKFSSMLYGLSAWYGVGIKTALGMGGCTVSNPVG